MNATTAPAVHDHYATKEVDPSCQLCALAQAFAPIDPDEIYCDQCDPSDALTEAEIDAAIVAGSEVPLCQACLAKSQVDSTATTCLVCGWGLTLAGGVAVRPEDLVTLTVSTPSGPMRDAVIHARCLMTDSVSVGGRLAELVGFRDADEAPTARGLEVLASRRIS